MNSPTQIVPALLQTFLDHARWVAGVLVDPERMILSHNPLFATLLGCNELLTGQSLGSVMDPASLKRLEVLSAAHTPAIKLTFTTQKKGNLSLFCQVFLQSETMLILGEKPMLTNDLVIETMGSLNNEMANLTRALQKKNRELEQANATIKTLRGILPICSFCKGIRNDEGYWKELEEYMSEQTEVLFSHSVCPHCYKKHYPDLFDD